MKDPLLSVLATGTAVLLANCATQMANDPNVPTGSPDATLTMSEVQAAYDVSATTGSGTLHFDGENYDFTVTSVGAGGTGAQEITASGKVYNLKRLRFPGYL